MHAQTAEASSQQHVTSDRVPNHVQQDVARSAPAVTVLSRRGIREPNPLKHSLSLRLRAQMQDSLQRHTAAVLRSLTHDASHGSLAHQNLLQAKVTRCRNLVAMHFVEDEDSLHCLVQACLDASQSMRLIGPIGDAAQDEMCQILWHAQQGVRKSLQR